MKYRDNMTAEELAALLAECNKLDKIYADAGDCSLSIHDEESLAHFNRFVAGDR